MTTDELYTLIAEMRDSLRDVTTVIDRLLMADGDPQPGSIGGIARSVISKADAALAERGKVRYGCHVLHSSNGEVFNNCAFDMADPLKECAQVLCIKRKEDCEHWKPIQQ